MTMWFDADGRALAPEPLRQGESGDARLLPQQMREAEYHAFFGHLYLSGQGGRSLREWLMDPAAVIQALGVARRGGLAQLRAAGVR